MNRRCQQALGSVMLDVEGRCLNENDVRRLQDSSVGGIILFSRNFESREQVCELIREVRSLREPELLIAVDQEGGRVQRFRDGFTRFPSMAVFGQLYDQAGAHPEQVLARVSSSAQLLAQELIECGVDFSFTPVLDLGLHEDTVIGDRAFHGHPKKLTAIASAFIQGMQKGGMQATGKHFPGHGHVLADSHLETPVDHRAFETIFQQDMQPFIALKEQLGAVMTAHIAFPEVDEALPTFSPFWLKEVLRNKVGFKGLIFSDDLTMHGAHGVGDIVQRTRLALDAGCDMILVCNDHDAMDELLAAGPFLASEKSQNRFQQMKARPTAPLANPELNQTRKFLEALV